jgi:hypothetical protein
MLRTNDQYWVVRRIRYLVCGVWGLNDAALSAVANWLACVRAI